MTLIMPNCKECGQPITNCLCECAGLTIPVLVENKVEPPTECFVMLPGEGDSLFRVLEHPYHDLIVETKGGRRKVQIFKINPKKAASNLSDLLRMIQTKEV